MMAWRVGRGWSGAELRAHLDRLSQLQRNYGGSHEAHMAGPEWESHRSRSFLTKAPPGLPADDGPFARGRVAVHDYAFSDPSIVEAYFDPDVPLSERRMLLELKPTVLRYLCGVVVGAVRDEATATASTYGFRYDTLEGHIESGSEWFLLEQDHASGGVTFVIEASWRPGNFPNWWSRVGFALLGKSYQRRWHTRAHRRMAAYVQGWPISKLTSRRHLSHRGPDVVCIRDVPQPALREDGQ